MIWPRSDPTGEAAPTSTSAAILTYLPGVSTPRLLIVGGSNGAGKSTFAVPYAEREGLPFLNADVLTRKYAAAGEDQPLIKAAREFLRKLYEMIDAGESVCVETTLSGGYVETAVARATAAGYRVELVFLFVASPEVAIQRVASRVKKGGHHVPDRDVRRRFHRTLVNFESLRQKVDMWELYRSDTSEITLVAKQEGDESLIFVMSDFQLFTSLLAES